MAFAIPNHEFVSFQASIVIPKKFVVGCKNMPKKFINFCKTTIYEKTRKISISFLAFIAKT
jgi:hypothetical protein